MVPGEIGQPYRSAVLIRGYDISDPATGFRSVSSERFAGSLLRFQQTDAVPRLQMLKNWLEKGRDRPFDRRY